MGESLADKLRSLGVKTGANDLPSPRNLATDIKSLISGNYCDSDFGSVFCAETKCENAYTHGNVPFLLSPINSRFQKWADGSFEQQFDLTSIAFIDTETTGLAGGTGTIPFMIGIGRFTSTGFVTSQLFIRNPGEERAQLDLLVKMLADVEAIVSYNGKAFDIPILNTRYTLNGFPSPFKTLAHFDLLPLSRRFWRRRLESRGLKDIETEILGYTRDQMDVPGWEIPVLYFNYLRSGDPAPLAGVFYHNVIDIQSLAALFLLFNSLAEDPDVRSNLHPVDHFSLAVQLESSGETELAEKNYESLLHGDLPDHIRVELQLRYARILKRRGDFEHTINVLSSGDSQNQIDIMISLAKILEHQQRDYISALEWTQIALNKISGGTEKFVEVGNTTIREDLLKRKIRLEKKINRDNNHD